MKSIIKITVTREIGGKKTSEARYYISSLNTSQSFNAYIRDHWRVENSLHWTLDMAFREDEQKKRNSRSAENFTIVRKITLNVLKKDKGKGSLVTKRLRAAWDKECLIKLLQI